LQYSFLWYRKLEKILWTDIVRNVTTVLQRVKEETSTLQTIKRRKAIWNCLILRRNCLLKHVIDGKVGRKIRNDGKLRKKTCRHWMTLRKLKVTGNWRTKH
jgi:hypothetical protein